jgi:steroid delta-isomerase-like uncharacterized protein
MNLTRNRTQVHNYIEQIWNQHDPDALESLVTPNFRRHLGPTQESIDAAGQKARIAMFQKAFPDLHFDVQDIVAEGDRAVFRVIVRGTHQAELFGVPKTGAKIQIEAVDVARLEDGKIAELWGVVDLMGLVQQLKAAAR